MEGKPLKICLLADSHGLYDDRIYWKEALSLKRNGFEVHYLLAGEESSTGKTKEGIAFTIIKRRHYVKNRYLNFLVKKIIPGGLYSTMFRKAAQLRADVYHIHDLKVNKIGRKLRSLPQFPKVIYDVHEPYPENIIDYHDTSGLLTYLKIAYSRQIRKWEINCAKKYDFIIATEENIRDRFRKILPDEKVDIIYNYTDLGSTRKEIPYEKKTYDAIYTGGITKRRGAMKILEATKIASTQRPDLKIIFLGTYFPSELKDEMTAYLVKNKLTKNVILHDPVPYSEVSEFYSLSRIGFGIFLPIPTHRIILQIKIFEYMNYGLPIIGSNFGHIMNYMKENDAGIAVDPEDPQEISEALLKLLQDRQLYDRMSKNGMKAVDEKYYWEIMEIKLVSIYRGLLSDRIVKK